MIAHKKQSRYTLKIFFLICNWFSYLACYFLEITLVYLDTFNQPINCRIPLNLVSIDLYRA